MPAPAVRRYHPIPRRIHVQMMPSNLAFGLGHRWITFGFGSWIVISLQYRLFSLDNAPIFSLSDLLLCWQVETSCQFSRRNQYISALHCPVMAISQAHQIFSAKGQATNAWCELSSPVPQIAHVTKTSKWFFRLPSFMDNSQTIAFQAVIYISG